MVLVELDIVLVEVVAGVELVVVVVGGIMLLLTGVLVSSLTVACEGLVVFGGGGLVDAPGLVIMEFVMALAFAGDVVF